MTDSGLEQWWKDLDDDAKDALRNFATQGDSDDWSGLDDPKPWINRAVPDDTPLRGGKES